MSRPGWLNDNAARDFPLQAGATFTQGGRPVAWPRSAIVDFGCLLGSLLGEPGNSAVVLSRAVLQDGQVRLEFNSQESNAPLVFVLDPAGDEYSTAFAEVFDAACGSLSLSGYVTVGDISGLVGLLAAGEITVTAVVEPYCVQSNAFNCVNSLNLASLPRTRVTPSAGCESSDSDSSSEAADMAIVTARCLQGDIRVVEGFNTAIRQSQIERSLTISAAAGAGAGVPCDEVPIAPAEMSSEGLLTGGPRCADLITSISGVGGPRIAIQQGLGVVVQPHASLPSTLVISVDLHDLTYCNVPLVSSSISEVEL